MLSIPFSLGGVGLSKAITKSGSFSDFGWPSVPRSGVAGPIKGGKLAEKINATIHRLFSAKCVSAAQGRTKLEDASAGTGTKYLPSRHGLGRQEAPVTSCIGW